MGTERRPLLFRRGKSFTVKKLVNRLCRNRRNARDLRQFCNCGRTNAFQTAEMAEQCFPPRGTDSWNRIKGRTQALFGPQLSMVGDGEAMGFIANALQEEQRCRVLSQN